jgi:ribonuclease Z
MSECMRVVILGSGGGGLLALGRRRTAQVVLVGEEPLLFDCGEGTTRQLHEAGIRPIDVKYLYFTHHHFDHNTDYPYFALSTWLEGRDENMKVYGPPGTAHFSNALFGLAGAFRDDLTARTTSPGSQSIRAVRGSPPLQWIGIDVVEIVAPGPICKTEKWTVTAAPTDHMQPYFETLAYRVDMQAKSIVVAVDSAPTQSVVDLARGADILIHDCSVSEEFRSCFGLARVHSGPAVAAEVAAKADVQKLVLTHFLPEFDNPESLAEMAREARSIFSGEVILAEDQLEIRI